jgi:ADP-heptose:LPS heptosyltransferase
MNGTLTDDYEVVVFRTEYTLSRHDLSLTVPAEVPFLMTWTETVQLAEKTFGYQRRRLAKEGQWGYEDREELFELTSDNPIFEYKGRLHDHREMLDKFDPSIRRYTLVRRGGAGDVLACAAVATALTKRHPRLKLDFLTGFENLGLISFDPAFTRRIPYPCRLDTLSQAPVLVFGQGTEKVRDPNMDIIDVFAASIGIELTPAEKQMNLYLPGGMVKKYKPWMDEIRRQSDLPVLICQLLPSGITRAFPVDRMLEILYRLKRENICNPVIVGAKEQIGNALAFNRAAIKHYGINVVIAFPDLLDMACFAYGADMFLAPDSILLHLGRAMNMPTVGLFGAIPALARAGDTRYLQGVGECSPCWENLPMPCEHAIADGTGACYGSITNDEIVEAIKEMR